MQELSRLSLLIGEEQLKKLSQKRVLVLGAGGVGGYAIESLARSGVGNLILVDHDTIDITNINRQLIALQSTIGKFKVDVWKHRIHDIISTCNVITVPSFITEDNINMIFNEKIDFVIDACDTITTKFALIKYCLNHKIPFITCLGTGKRMDPSQIEITDLLKTKNDPLAKILRKKIREEHIKQTIPVVYSKEQPQKIDSKTIASSIFVPSSAGIMSASYAIKQLLGRE